MSANFQTKRFVEFADTDMAGIAHFTAFFRYMESAEHELLRHLGLSVFSETEEGPISFPRVSVRCDYQSPVMCEDVVDIEVAVVRVGEKSVTYEFNFTKDGEPIAVGQVTCVCCRIGKGVAPTSIPIPADVAAKLSAMVTSGDAKAASDA
jgi:acyl-CoA thioester hydrolase